MPRPLEIAIDAPRAFAPFALLEDYLALGWMVIGDLDWPHGQWACLAAWPCRCREARVPRRQKKAPPEGGASVVVARGDQAGVPK